MVMPSYRLILQILNVTMSSVYIRKQKKNIICFTIFIQFLKIFFILHILKRIKINIMII